MLQQRWRNQSRRCPTSVAFTIYKDIWLHTVSISSNYTHNEMCRLHLFHEMHCWSYSPCMSFSAQLLNLSAGLCFNPGTQEQCQLLIILKILSINLYPKALHFFHSLNVADPSVRCPRTSREITLHENPVLFTIMQAACFCKYNQVWYAVRSYLKTEQGKFAMKKIVRAESSFI